MDYKEWKFDDKFVYFLPLPYPRFEVSETKIDPIKEILNKSKEKYNELKEKSIKIIKEKIDEKKVQLAYILVTSNCNLRCDYCFIEKKINWKNKDYMNEETCIKGINLLFSDKTKEKKIIFYGGEPLLNFKIIKFAVETSEKIAKDKNIKIQYQIISNGTIFSKEIAKFIKDHKISLAFSIDGPAKIHDLHRKEINRSATYYKIYQNYQKYAKEDINIGLSVTISEESSKALPENIFYLIKHFKPKSIGLNLPILYEKDVTFIVRQLLVASLLSAKMKVYEDRIGRRVRSILNKEIYVQDCAAYGSQFVLSPEGKINYCHGLYPINKFTDWNTYDEKKRSKWKDVLKNFYDTCNDCPFFTICGYGCHYRTIILKKEKDDIVCTLVKEQMRLLALEQVMDLKWIVFDFDGIIKLFPDYKKVLLNMFKDDKEMVFKINGSQFTVLEVKEFLRKNYSDFENKYKEFITRMENGSRLNYPLLDVIFELKKQFKIGIFSGGKPERAQWLKGYLERQGIDFMFDKIVTRIKTDEAYTQIPKLFESPIYSIAFITHTKDEFMKSTNAGIFSIIANTRREQGWILNLLKS